MLFDSCIYLNLFSFVLCSESCVIGLMALDVNNKRYGKHFLHLCLCAQSHFILPWFLWGFFVFHPHPLLPLSHTVTLRHSLPFLYCAVTGGMPFPQNPPHLYKVNTWIFMSSLRQICCPEAASLRIDPFFSVSVCLYVCVFSISRLSSCCPYVAVRERCVSICWVNAWVRPSATCSPLFSLFHATPALTRPTTPLNETPQNMTGSLPSLLSYSKWHTIW